jgi:hypothetical protein
MLENLTDSLKYDNIIVLNLVLSKFLYLRYVYRKCGHRQKLLNYIGDFWLWLHWVAVE